MFADMIEGAWNNQFDSQTYKHLQTWVKVSVCAMTMETINHWGNITKVSISSKSHININPASGDNKVSYSASTKDIVAYENQFGQALNLTSHEIGSVFCIPEEITRNGKRGLEITVTVNTSIGATKTVHIPLYNTQYEALDSLDDAIGRLFILTLYFNPFSIVEGTCTLNYWNDQNEDLYLTPPSTQTGNQE
jgi:hypothetical protein